MSGPLQFKSTAIFFNQLRGLSKILNSMDRYLVFFTRLGAIVNQEVGYFTRTTRSHFQIARPPTPGDQIASSSYPSPGPKD